MARKPKYNGGTDNKFVEEATKLFFNNGYEGTSIRSICKAVNCEVGLFYYYYKSKSDLFDICLEEFFIPYRLEFQSIVDGAKENSKDAIFVFFECLKKITREFRAKYSAKMHRNIRLAIREATVNAIEPYIAQIISLLKLDGICPIINEKLASVILAHGIGGVILHEDSDWVDNAKSECDKLIRGVLNL